jgi:hypothetical protein
LRECTFGTAAIGAKRPFVYGGDGKNTVEYAEGGGVANVRTPDTRQREGRNAAPPPVMVCAMAKFGSRAGCEDCGACIAPLQSCADSEVILPAAMAGGNTGLVLCQVGGQ